MKPVFKVAIPNTHFDHFDYHADGLQPTVGMRVKVPFRAGERIGVVIEIGAPDHADRTLKSIIEVLDDEPLLPQTILELCRWVSRYYQASLSSVLAMALPKYHREGREAESNLEEYYVLTTTREQALEVIPARSHRLQALLALFSDAPLPISAIRQEGFTKAQLQALMKHRLIQLSAAPEKKHAIHTSPALVLNTEQAFAQQTIVQALDTYKAFLLQGVTGSGKTEVYLQVVEQVLSKGGQALILVPEIGLTPQLLTRFGERFGYDQTVVIHSQLNHSERQRAWDSAKQRRAKLVIGTRTAVFTPMPSLGLIVIDEEHDSSLKQMTGVRYSARDTALMRAYQAGIPIILGSATPSLESVYNGSIGKYTVLPLSSKALESAPLHYKIQDIRNQCLTHGLSEEAMIRIKNHLQQGKQVLVFINRRGFAPVWLCHQCGWMADCHSCDSHLTFHRGINRLVCHHCGASQPVITTCQTCHSQEFIPVGIGTQRVEEYLAASFPATTVLRLDRDEMTKKNRLNERLEQINTGQAQLIVGTQMLAKGHHFPRLTLVVVLDADNGFYNQDFRGLEHLGQLLVQVAGRAGRAEHAGEILIQTHLPHHPMLNLLVQQGYEPFAQALLATRQEAQLPPYHFLALIRAQGRYSKNVEGFLNNVKSRFNHAEISVLGPVPSPLARKANLYQMQLLLKASKRRVLQSVLQQVRQYLKESKFSGVRWGIDVDPIES